MSGQPLANNIVFLVFGALLGYFLSRFFSDRRIKQSTIKTKELLEKAEREGDNKIKEAEIKSRDMLIQLRENFEKETKDRREELSSAEKRISQKEENLEKRVDLLERKEKDIEGRVNQLHQNEVELKEKDIKLEQLIEEEKHRLQKISSMTSEEAKTLLLSRVDDELIAEKATRIREMDEELKTNADKKAKEILSSAIHRCASDHAGDTTISVVHLPSDEMKGRIIGREGRNIRAFEMATGVDIIIDDTPEAVTISGFDMMRREIAKISLERLIHDGRIHPGRIEEVVEKVKKEIDTKVKEEGEQATFDLGIHGMHPELVKLVGKLKYRTSFGQNALRHSKEVASLMGIMASQLNLDFKVARRAGLLHDIGKVAGEDIEGPHAIIGAEISRKYGEQPDVVRAIESHHEEVEMNIYGILVAAADAVSAARPGARAETMETYVKRIESLEKIATSFNGIDKAYALQAGREVRIMVKPNKINDDESIVLSREIRKKIESDMEYPGQIKVIVIRETRATEYAK
ncbi:MAG: ribonuclease Y [Candidatus Omnitrophica bacterium]|nr:ribonuclease Y [Candidatus Omnitrophota bacterium]